MDNILPAEAEPLPQPIPREGRTQIISPGFPLNLNTPEEVDGFVDKMFSDFKEFMTMETDRAICEKLAFRILQHTRLTPKALQYMRTKFLPSMTWDDVYPRFYKCLSSSSYRDYRAIPTFLLQRSRIPLQIFKTLLKDLDVSRQTLGPRSTLENEAAVQLAIHPIPTTLLKLFNGRLTNLPEQMLKGQLGNSGRCEFTITFGHRLVLLFIEVKYSLTNNYKQHSDVVAQVIAECDGADTYNQSNECDGLPVFAVLTDGISYEFYVVEFHRWTIFRGTGGKDVGIEPWQFNKTRVTLPADERDPNYLPKLKVIVELIFDLFIQVYVNALMAQVDYPSRRARFENTAVGSAYVRRKSTNSWSNCLFLATKAQTTLRRAHRMKDEAAGNDTDEMSAEVLAREGINQLYDSTTAGPSTETEWSYLDDWEEKKITLLHI